MATFTKLSGGRVKARIRMAGTSRSMTFRSIKNARIWARRIEAEIEETGARGLGSTTLRNMTMSTLVKDYAEHWTGKGRGQLVWCAWWDRQLGGVKVLQLERHHIQQVLEKYLAGNAQGRGRDGRLFTQDRKRSGASADRILAVLSAVLSWGMAHRGLDRNVARNVPKYGRPGRRERFLSEEELDRLLEAAKDSGWPKLHALILLAVTTGARRGELMSLRWSDLDWDRRRAVIPAARTKNGKPKVLTIAPEAMDALVDLREIGNHLVFCGTRPMTPYSFVPHWQAALIDAGLEDQGIVFHSLRHSCASYLAKHGASLHQIAGVLGHSGTGVTQRYAHLLVDDQQSMVDRVFAGVLGGGDR